MAVINGIAHSSGGFYPVEIQQSLRFDRASNASLSRTPSAVGNRKTWTFSTWVKRSKVEGVCRIFSSVSVPDDTSFRFDGNNLHYYDLTQNIYLQSLALFRDVSAWYHLVLAIDTTQSTASERVRMFVNGNQLFEFSSEDYPLQNADTMFNNTIKMEFSALPPESCGGYIAETYFIDGQALDATAFGEFKNGVWVPKKYNGSYGTNGFHLDFSDGANIGADRSGNGNDYTPTNLASTDIMLDSPTNNYATLTPQATIWGLSFPDFSEGNTKITVSADSPQHAFGNTLVPDQGKWYWEVHVVNAGSGSPFGTWIGMGTTGRQWGVSEDHLYNQDGRLINNPNPTGAYGSTYTSGDVVGVLADRDSNEITFFVNGASQGARPTTGKDFIAMIQGFKVGVTLVLNHGQDSSFAGTKTRQGFTDASGRGDFYYQPPAGALALCTANLPEPVFSPLDDSLPSDHFNTIVWNGDGATTRSLTGVGFQPDWVWSKARNTAYSNIIWDAVRGGNYELAPNYDTAELGNSPFGWITSFDNDGFSVTGGTTGTEHVNQSGTSYVAWNWKAGGAPVTNNAGSITSTVSANVEAGFSIVTWTGGDQPSNSTVGHGLSKSPEVYIFKNRSTTGVWPVLTTAIDGSLDYMHLEQTGAALDSADNLPTDSTVSLSSTWLLAANDYVMYCFHSVEGFSKIGTYNGNGILNDGTFVYTGFKPAYVMVKRTDAAGNWHVFDNTRDSYNPVDQMLNPNLVDAETVYPGGIDFLSNGFKHLGTGAGLNADGGTYLYMAFAEMPFKYANGR